LKQDQAGGHHFPVAKHAFSISLPSIGLTQKDILPAGEMGRLFSAQRRIVEEPRRDPAVIRLLRHVEKTTMTDPGSGIPTGRKI